MEQRGAQGQVAVTGGGREEGFAFVEGDEQQIALAGLVPEHALAVVAGGAVGIEYGEGLAQGPPAWAGAEQLSAEQGADVQIEAEAALSRPDDARPGLSSDDGGMAKAPLVTQEALKAFTDRLVEAFAPEQVILFGSMARGTAGLESDADVLVVMPFEGRALEKILEIREVCDPQFPLDLLLWRPEDIAKRYRWRDPFIRAALDHGVLLHG